MKKEYIKPEIKAMVLEVMCSIANLSGPGFYNSYANEEEDYD